MNTYLKFLLFAGCLISLQACSTATVLQKPQFEALIAQEAKNSISVWTYHGIKDGHHVIAISRGPLESEKYKIPLEVITVEGVAPGEVLKLDNVLIR